MLALPRWSNTLVSLFKKHQTLEQCKQIQSIIVTSGLYSTQDNNTLFLTKLLQCVPFSQNQNTCLLLLFDTINTPNTRLLNKMIAACSHPHISLLCYAKLRQKGVQPDKHTFPLLLKTFLYDQVSHQPNNVITQPITNLLLTHRPVIHKGHP